MEDITMHNYIWFQLGLCRILICEHGYTSLMINFLYEKYQWCVYIYISVACAINPSEHNLDDRTQLWKTYFNF